MKSTMIRQKMELLEVETTQCTTECNEANYIEKDIDFSEDIKAKRNY